MDKQNLMPQAAQPVNRITTGQLPAELAELSEEALQQHECDAAAVSASYSMGTRMCSYDGDDAE
jgi:bacteriocin leader peptide (microcyclamide/patellamide family)